MQSTVVKGPIMTDNTSIENVLDPLLLDQKFVESEESHYVRNKDLLRCITLVLKNDSFEKFK